MFAFVFSFEFLDYNVSHSFQIRPHVGDQVGQEDGVVNMLEPEVHLVADVWGVIWGDAVGEMWMGDDHVAPEGGQLHWDPKVKLCVLV